MKYPFQSIENTFVRNTLPIYSESRKNKLDHIGTSILLNINKTYFVVTAGHVIDNCENFLPCLQIGKHLQGLEGFYVTMTNDKGNRSDDIYDFAFAKLTIDDAKTIGLDRFIDINFLLQNSRLIKLDYFTFLGYPNSKNKVKIRIIPKPVSFRSSLIGLEEYRKSQYKQNDHIAISHEKKNVADEDGSKRTLPKLVGMSGGLALQWYINYNTHFRKLSIMPLLAGVVVDKNDNNSIFYATRIEIIINEICNVYFDKFSPFKNVTSVNVERYK